MLSARCHDCPSTSDTGAAGVGGGEEPCIPGARYNPSLIKVLDEYLMSQFSYSFK